MAARVKLIPHVRLFNPSLPFVSFSTMNPNLPAQVSRKIPMFSRMFPHKLKYSKILWFPILPARISCQNEMAARQLSTRSSRSRTNSGSEVQASKSLIDDEAELSDWVSGLSSGSYPSHFNSDRDDDREDRNLGRNVRGNVDEKGRKRMRESSSDDFAVSHRGSRSRGRGSFGPNSGNSRAQVSVFGYERGRSGGGGLRPGMKGGGRRGFLISDEDDMDGEDDDHDVSKSVSKSKGRNSYGSLSRNSRDKGSTLERARDRRVGGLRRGRKDERRQFAEPNDDDAEDSDGEEEKDLSLRELMSEEESDEDDDDEDVPKLGNSFSRVVGEDGLPISSRISPDRSNSDSYLSETRFAF